MRRYFKTIFILIVGLIVGFYLRDLFSSPEAQAKLVRINSRNLNYEIATYADTVGEVLAEQQIHIEDQFVSHEATAPVRSGMTISLHEPLSVTIIDGSDKRTISTQAEIVSDVIFEQGISLSVTDQVAPPPTSFLTNNEVIQIDRIVDLEVIENSLIQFSIERQNTPTEPYGRESIVSSGKMGEKQEKFLITYKNGTEVARKLLSSVTLSEPVNEIRTFGTKIEVDFFEEGRASWYQFRNCLCAAFPQAVLGRYVRVTRLDTGTTIIVQINDFGPDRSIHPERVIDLDRVAFSRLASLGAGTIPVRVELIKN